ncbi:MAG TPA: CBM35 domain-containing protein [Lachnospiraceae bacterium]|nr:CBM35 domain-containing protein [Lachnospiraceae bacterium]
MRKKYYLILLSILCICSACSKGDGNTKQVVSDKNVMEDDVKDNTKDTKDTENSEEESKVENDSKQPNAEGEKQEDMVVENMVEQNEKYDASYEEIFEAENGKFTGNVKVGSKKEGFTGEGYVEGIEEDSDTCTVSIEVPGSGLYDISIICASFSGYKENFVCLDGEQVGVAKVESDDFTDSILEKVYIAAGMHEITIKKSWGWIYLDAIKVVASAPVDEDMYKVSANLVDPGATDSAKRLMQYITDSYGKVILSGQPAECNNSTSFRDFYRVINSLTF